MTALSAWCSTAPGVPRHDAQHRVCAMRLKAGLIASCSCPGHRPPVVAACTCPRHEKDKA
jgi:hypothetical protein